MSRNGNASGVEAAGAKDEGKSSRSVAHAGRGLSDDAVQHMAEAVRAYTLKPGSRGAAFLLDSKRLRHADRRAVALALSDLEGER